MSTQSRFFDYDCPKCGKKLGHVTATPEVASDASFVVCYGECPQCGEELEFYYQLGMINGEDV